MQSRSVVSPEPTYLLGSDRVGTIVPNRHKINFSCTVLCKHIVEHQTHACPREQQGCLVTSYVVCIQIQNQLHGAGRVCFLAGKKDLVPQCVRIVPQAITIVDTSPANALSL